jgi:hypothetical protein
MVRSPGFEPGSSAWEADVLAKLDYDRVKHISQIKANLNFYLLPYKRRAKLLSFVNPKRE